LAQKLAKGNTRPLANFFAARNKEGIKSVNTVHCVEGVLTLYFIPLSIPQLFLFASKFFFFLFCFFKKP